MELQLLLAIISGTLIAVPHIIYIISILKGETKPHIYSRFLYFIITIKLIICDGCPHI